MGIISKETFEKLTEEEKKKLRELYSNSVKIDFAIMKKIFGEENLLHKPNIKTWKDVKDKSDSAFQTSLNLNYACDGNMDDKLSMKIKATYKISKLIELGYGGIVTEEECKENGAWQIIPYRENYDEKFKLKIVMDFQQKSFISFHNEEQAKEFMSYPGNRILIEQYYMI